MTNSMTDKMAIRQLLRKKRSALPAFRQHLASSSLARRILRNISAINRAEKIAFYLAQDGEIDLLPLLVHCFGHGRHCYLPVLEKPDEKILAFAEWTPQQSMLQNQYGIAEPVVPRHQLLSAADMDVIFMPLVAFDDNGNRLGMGGGYYDRSLAECCTAGSRQTTRSRPSKRCPLLIATGHDIQHVPQLPQESWDIIPNVTITPGRIIKPALQAEV